MRTLMKSHERTRVLVSLFLAATLATGPVLGQQNEQGKTYEVKFMGERLEEVVNVYGNLTGRTPLVAPRVKVNTTITVRGKNKLTKQEYIDAIESILALHDVALIPHGEKFVKVVNALEAPKHAMKTETDPFAEPPAETDQLLRRIVTLKHMDPVEAEAVIGTFKSTHGTIQKLERIKGLLITDSAGNINRILEILEQVDQPIERREEVFVRPIMHAKPSEIKAKLEEIIADLKEKAKAIPTVARPRASGPPGVIRARRPAAPRVSAAPDVDVEKGLIRGQVKIVADDRTGVLIFVTLKSNMKFFNQIVDALDIETAPDVLVKVYRLEFASAESVATMLNSLIGAKSAKGAPTPAAGKAETKGGALEEYIRERKPPSEVTKSKVGELSAAGIKILPDKRTNTLIIMASQADQAALAEIIKDMDIMLSQVLIEAVIIEVTLTDNLQTGVDWIQRSMLAYDKDATGKRSPIIAFTGKGGGGKTQPADATGTPTFPAGGGLTYYLTHFGLNMDVVIRAASEDERTRVVSTPIILTTDNKPGTIETTETIYVYGGKTDTSYGTTEVWKEKPVRTILDVTPQINENKVVMMTITQTTSEPGAVLDEPKAGAKIESTRTMKATIAVRDGETIILGGQVRTKMGKTRNKIPLLGDIPILGRLFNSTTDTKTRTEMIVFITPYVLDTPEEIEAEAARRKKALDIKGVWKRGWSDSKLADPTAEDLREMKKDARERRRALKAEAAKGRKAAEEEAKQQRIAEEEAEKQRKAEEEAENQRKLEEEQAAKQREAEESASNVAGPSSEERPVDPQVQDLIDREAARWRSAERRIDTISAESM